MKKFISLLVALVLLVSTFALPVVAFADEATADDNGGATQERTVKFSTEAFKKYVLDANPELTVEMSDTFQLSQEWLEDEEAIHELFDGINYRVLPAEDIDEDDEDLANYKLTYSLGEGDDNHAKEGVNAPSVESHPATKHVNLPSAIEAAEDYKFVGWTVEYTPEGEEKVTEIYRASEVIAMPACDVTATAIWAEKDAEIEDDTFTYPVNDIIYLEYCAPSDDPRDDKWSNVVATNTFSMQTEGWWMFRYTVIDGADEKTLDDKDATILTKYNDKDWRAANNLNDSDGVFDWNTCYIIRSAGDVSHPVVELSESMKTKQKDGLEVGTNYSISTSLTTTDSSSTTVTYVVYKNVGVGAEGADAQGWVKIYDSKTSTVTEGYDDCISTGGTITPLKSDVTGSLEYRYKVVYSVKDRGGFYGIKEEDKPSNHEGEEGYVPIEYNPTLLLSVHLSEDDAKTKQQMDAWKIALFVIAGVAAIGIVLLLVIKPKHVAEGDARVKNAEEGGNNKPEDESEDNK